jgi:hypothetical protein
MGNLLRITSVGTKHGLTESEIAKIFILRKGHNYVFSKTSVYDEFRVEIEKTLKNGHACFAGYTHATGGGHVVIIARHGDPKDATLGEIVLIDPQQGEPCYLKDADCAARLKGTSWHLLFRSTEELTAEQLATLGEGFRVEGE